MGRRPLPRRSWWPVLALPVLAGCASTGALPGRDKAGPQTVMLTAPDGRPMAVRLLHPLCEKGRRYPLLLFSHGANSAPAKYDRLTSGWAERGYIVAAPLHADSPDHPGGGKVDQARSWSYRIADMRLLMDRSSDLERASGCRAAAGRIAAAGHSYGALVAQALGGARVENQPDARDRRIRAVVAFSPPGPIPGYISTSGWEGIAVPMFVQTGTADVLPMVAPTWDKHMASFEASRAPAVLFVGEGVDHYFGNIIGRPERPPAGGGVTRAFAAALDLSTDFLRAELDRDPRARQRLDPASVKARYAGALARYERRP
jgi:predicted dienelactone hydrolase